MNRQVLVLVDRLGLLPVLRVLVQALDEPPAAEQRQLLREQRTVVADHVQLAVDRVRIGPVEHDRVAIVDPRQHRFALPVADREGLGLQALPDQAGGAELELVGLGVLVDLGAWAQGRRAPVRENVRPLVVLGLRQFHRALAVGEPVDAALQCPGERRNLAGALRCASLDFGNHGVPDAGPAGEFRPTHLPELACLFDSVALHGGRVTESCYRSLLTSADRIL